MTSTSEHQKEADGLPLAEDVERWELHGSDLDDLPVEREKSSTKLPHSSTNKSPYGGLVCWECPYGSCFFICQDQAPRQHEQ
ncbi:unnamed protein product [Prunus armeniaca]